jgi:epsilon-lactone hydrolase
MVYSIIKMIVLHNRRKREKLVLSQNFVLMRKEFEKALNNPLLYVRHKSQKVNAGGVPARWISRGKPGPVILYLHGGGYVVGSPAAHRLLVAAIIKRTGGRALLIDYHLAPEHPFPAQRDDACASYQWLLENGIKPSSIAVMGESAGGGLTIAMVQELKKRGIPLPACCAVLSPWSDVSLSGATIKQNAAVDILLTYNIINFYALCFAGKRKINDTELSPLFNEMNGLPPVLIQVGSYEMLLDDSRKLAERIRQAGGKVILEEYPKMFHGFHVFERFLGNSKKAIENIGRFVTAHSLAE